MSYDYDEPEAAIIDLLENNEEEVVYGMVKVKWSEEVDGRMIFIDIDSGHQERYLDNKSEDEMFIQAVNTLFLTDEEIRSEL